MLRIRPWPSVIDSDKRKISKVTNVNAKWREWKQIFSYIIFLVNFKNKYIKKYIRKKVTTHFLPSLPSLLEKLKYDKKILKFKKSVYKVYIDDIKNKKLLYVKE